MTMNDETRRVALKDIRGFAVVALAVALAVANADKLVWWQMIRLHSQYDNFEIVEPT